MESIATSDGHTSINTVLAEHRTSFSFQRTRMSADRTLMSYMRTALSLIGFGFTIFQFFQKLKIQGNITRDAAPRNFGLCLVSLGMGFLIAGITYHIHFMLELRREKKQLASSGILDGTNDFPISATLIVSLLLFLLGGAAIISMVFNVGPFN